MSQTYRSPGVYVKEVDNSLVTAPTSISTMAGVIVAGWGPAMQPMFIDGETSLVAAFGQPNNRNAASWFAIANGLGYGDNTFVARIESEEQTNANSLGKTGWKNETFVNSEDETVDVVDENGKPVRTRVGLVINNKNDYDGKFMNGSDGFGEFAARYPGSLGNSIMVTYADHDSYDQWKWVDQYGVEHDWRQEFANRPGTSDYAAKRGGENDEIHLLVVDAGGKFTGTTGTILERYEYLSKSSDAKNANNASQYYRTVLNDYSDYVYWMDLPACENLVANYSKEVVAIIDSADEQEQQLIDDNKVVPGDLIVNIDQQLIKILAKQYVISDQGVRTIKLVWTEHAKLEDWTGRTIFNISTNVAHIVQGEGQSNRTINPVPAIEQCDWGNQCENHVFTSLKAPTVNRLSGGTDGWDYTDGEEIRAFDLFVDKEKYNIGLIITGTANAVVSKHVIENICQVRMDCVAFVSPVINRGPILGSVTDEDRLNGVVSSDLKIMKKTLDWRQSVNFNVSSSYGHLDSGWKYQYDKYNDCNRWVPLNGDCAGIYARTDTTNDPWWPGAGFNRGQVKNVIKLSFNPNKDMRDQIYPMGINPVVTFVGDGTILYGDRTLQKKPSAFDRMNVRRLFIYIEKILSESAKYLLFEFNDDITRRYAISLVDPVLKEIRGGRGIRDYRVICDESNNTDEVINTNGFKMDIKVIPNYSINFIELSFHCEKNGSSTFTEIEG